jgi:putative peptidoglycan lipid II flippase
MTAVLVVSAWCLAVLNSHRRFFLPYFAPVLWNLSVVGALVWLATLGGAAAGVRDIVLVMSGAALVGGVLQFAVQLPATLRLVGRIDPRPSLDAPGVRQALRAFGPAVAGRGVAQLSGWLDLFLASWLATGALAALGYAQRLHALPLALFGTSFAVVELPELSRLREQDAAARRLAGSFAAAVFLTVPSAVGLLVFGFPIVRAVYERGRFDADASWLVYGVLGAYSLGLLPSVGSRLLQNVFLASGDTRTPAAIALVRVLLAAGAGALLMVWLDRFEVSEVLGVPASGSGAGARAGAVGLAVGSALGAWLELWALRRTLARRALAASLPWERAARAAGRSVLAAVPTALVWWLARAWHAITLAPLLVCVFAGVYLLVAVWRKEPEASAILDQIRALRRRGGGTDGAGTDGQ